MDSSIATPVAEPITLAAFLGVLTRRRWMLLCPVVALAAIAGLSCLLAVPRFRAVAEVEVHGQDGGGLGMETAVAGSAPAEEDAMDYSMTLHTEAAVLLSPALATQVIEASGLENTPDYFEQRPPGAFSWVRSILFWRKPLEPMRVPLSDAPNRRYVAERIFAGHLKVTPVAGTRLIDIAYADPSPERAARVANVIVRVLSDMDFEQQAAATLRGSSWLAGQLHELRARAEQAAQRAAVLQRGTGLFGDDAAHNVVLERLDSLNQTLTEAESNRILKESIDRVATEASPELISTLSGNSSTGSVASVDTSLSLLQGLRAQQAQTRSQLAEARVRYGAAYPRVAELTAQLANIDASIAAETKRLGQRAHTDYEVALRTQEQARTAFEKQQALAARQNDSVIAYEMARQEADSSRELYEEISTKLKEASLLEGLRVNNVSIVSPAQVPPPDHPSSPNVLLRMAIAVAGGLLLAICMVAWAELTDASVGSFAEVERAIGVRLLAVLPSRTRLSMLRLRIERAGSGGTQLDLFPVLDPRASLFSEGLRSLRTSLRNARAGEPPRIVLVTSPMPGDGKTMVAANLAVLFAQTGERVLLVDADMRRPGLHHYGLPSQACGLAFALSGSERVEPRQPIPALPGLHLLAGSEVPAFPSELLVGARAAELIAEWRARYDMVILDSPPVLPVTDATLLAREADAVVLVARHRSTPRASLRRAVETLHSSTNAPIGVVMNDVAPESSDFHAYFGRGDELYAHADA